MTGGGTVSFSVNGAPASAPESMVLLSALRDHLGLTGAKLGCGEGACGACTVLIDGAPVRSCQRTAGSAEGQQITTIEALSEAGGQLHPVQRAFADEGAAQCGFCTPGMILTTAALLAAQPRPTDGAIDEAMATQICRCGSYPRIRRAVHRAASLIDGTADDAADGGTGAAGTPAAGTGHDVADEGPDADRWGPPLPGAPRYR